LDELRIDQRYEGFPGISHCGYLAGVVANELGPSVAVTLVLTQAGVPLSLALWARD